MSPQEPTARHNLQFYQCSNPECGLRFPGPLKARVDPMVCPRCQSPVQVVPTRSQIEEYNPRNLAGPDNPRLEVLLDNIRSSFNVGAMLRTSDGAGVAHVHLCGITPQPGNPRIAKVALGAEFSVPWTYHPSAVQAVQECKTRGLKVWALEIHPDTHSIFEIPPEITAQTAVLVVGNEVSGIDPAIHELCDDFFWIPMQGYKRSLNVAVAFGIAVYTLRSGALSNRQNLDPGERSKLK